MKIQIFFLLISILLSVSIITANASFTVTHLNTTVTLNKNTSAKNESAESFAVKAPIINNETDLFTVLDYFTNVKTNVLPYSYKNKIDSIVTRKSLLKFILSSKLINEMTVEKIMTFPVIAADADTGLITAKKIMSDHKLGRLIVLKNNSPIGIISMKDIVYKFSLNEKLPEMKDVRFNINNINIGSLCERNVKTIEYNKLVSDATRRIVEQGISSLVVVKDKKYIGIITISDILKNIQINEQIQENKIFIIGIDDETKEYEDEIREQLRSEINKIEKMKSDYKEGEAVLRLKTDLAASDSTFAVIFAIFAY